ncbi:diaminopropionate ammonia-lyase [Caballeronia sp. GAFFF1]|uniref:diaminopropionate ammonia-lyase n=1 Tax=Caballeronia sp. GAFFF1 TaxID=2921779 RepID=UPI0020280719|nr:diaminopropionate ammonia-lyase [Caballeronia sp. GAFFF1]
MRVHINRNSLFGSALDAADQSNFHPEVVSDVRRFLSHVPYQETPLQSLPALASELRVGGILVKDEGARSRLGSFKALGGTHAVIRLVIEEASKRLGRQVEPEQLKDEAVHTVAKGMTFACATDGNHGRAVAAGAQLSGASCNVFVHSGVSEARADAIAAEGATVTRTAGNYDDSIAALNAAADQHGWQVVSDTSWPGYETIPSRVMQGYLVMAEESVRQAGEAGLIPTHVFLQAGVGGYAAAVAAYLKLKLGEKAPVVVVVEPERAACLFESARNGAVTRIDAEEPTVMAMLECYEPSAVAWRILQRTTHAFVTVDESPAIEAMRTLAKPRGNDPRIVSGESGGAGVAALLEASQSPALRQALGLNEKSVVLLFNTEGATDAATYRALIGDEEAAL